jgi:hypothetical protein
MAANNKALLLQFTCACDQAPPVFVGCSSFAGEPKLRDALAEIPKDGHGLLTEGFRRDVVGKIWRADAETDVQRPLSRVRDLIGSPAFKKLERPVAVVIEALGNQIHLRGKVIPPRVLAYIAPADFEIKPAMTEKKGHCPASPQSPGPAGE